MTMRILTARSSDPHRHLDSLLSVLQSRREQWNGRVDPHLCGAYDPALTFYNSTIFTVDRSLWSAVRLGGPWGEASPSFEWS